MRLISARQAEGENHGDVAAVGSRGNPKRGSIRGAWLWVVREQRARVWEGRAVFPFFCDLFRAHPRWCGLMVAEDEPHIFPQQLIVW